MIARYSPFIALVLLSAVFGLFSSELIIANDAFFMAAAIGIWTIGMQFASRASQPFSQAVFAILAKPSSYKGRAFGYAAFLAVAVLATVFSANMVALA